MDTETGKQKMLALNIKLVLVVVLFIAWAGFLFLQQGSQLGKFAENDIDSVQWVDTKPVSLAVNWNQKGFTPSNFTSANNPCKCSQNVAANGQNG